MLDVGVRFCQLLLKRSRHLQWQNNAGLFCWGEWVVNAVAVIWFDEVLGSYMIEFGYC
jgi:hypothetical protein